MKDKITSEQKNQLESEIKKVEEAIASNDTDRIKTATDGLTKVWNEISQKLYAQQGPTPGAQSSGEPFEGQPQGEQQQESSSDKKDEKNVEDASYEVVDDDKK
jgi:molecular chaperone DnaK